MQKTKQMIFEDGSDSWELEVTYNLPSIRSIINLQREARTSQGQSDEEIVALEALLAFCQQNITNLVGDIEDVDELPVSWIEGIVREMSGANSGNG